MRIKFQQEFLRRQDEITEDTVIRDRFAREQYGSVTNREGSKPRKFSDHKGC